MKVKPLFMWAGGKTKMLKHHGAYLPATCEVYSEPFFGGGAMFLHVQEVFKPKQCYISDVNPGIVNVYRSIKQNPAEFCGIVNTYQKQYLELDKVGRKQYYYDLRHEHAYNYEGWSSMVEAATLYFLMKTGFNGVWQINKNTNNRYGTPSGLLNQKDSVYDQNNVLAWNELLQNTVISCGDYSQCPAGDFNYLDPPYRVSHTTYGTGWGDAETDKLIEYAKDLPGTTLLCNRDDGSDYFAEKCGAFSLATFDVSYTVGRKGGIAAREVLLYQTRVV